MKYLQTLTAAALIVIGYSGNALGAGLTDQYDPYVSAAELHAVPANPTMAEQRMADIYDPFILANEIVVSEGCTNPANALIADQYVPFVTLAELKSAEMNKKC